MTDKAFVRDDASSALINTDSSGFEQYRMNRRKAKYQRTLEQRVEDLERLVGILMKERP